MAQNIEELLSKSSGIRLDLGCGRHKQRGFVGMDMLDLPGVDIVWDVEDIPWPLPDECVVVVMASHLVEHLNPHKMGFVKFMNEVWRVCRPDAKFAISMPYCTSPGFFQDPTHCNPCNEATWAYFDPLEPNTKGLLYRFYEPKPWALEHLSWNPVGNMEVIMRKRPDVPSYHGR